MQHYIRTDYNNSLTKKGIKLQTNRCTSKAIRKSVLAKFVAFGYWRVTAILGHRKLALKRPIVFDHTVVCAC